MILSGIVLLQVDGDSLSGICFVGYFDHIYRVGFVLVPVGLVLIASVGLLGSGLVTLSRLQFAKSGVISDRASAQIRNTTIRLGKHAIYS